MTEKRGEEPQEMSSPDREEQEVPTERGLQEPAHTSEASRLARAFRQARIRAWFWAADTRLTRYLPAPGDARESPGEAAGEAPFQEDRLLQAHHPDDQERVARVWNKAYEGHGPYEIDYRITTEDGSVRHQHESAMPEFDEAGRYLGHVGITQDITDQKVAEAAREQTARLLTEAERIASIGHWKFNEEGEEMLLCSEQAAAIFGLSRDAFLVSSRSHDAFLQLVHEDDRSFVDNTVRAYYRRFDKDPETATSLELEYRIVRPAGEVRYVLERAEPKVNEDGRISRSVGTIQDITEKKAIEDRLRQAQKMEAVGQLTGGIAHDFNNILAVIQGNCDLLGERLGEDDPLLASILRASERGAELTQHLLAFSRQQPLQPRPTDLTELMASMKLVLERTLGEIIDLKIDSSGQAARAMADPGQVENALLNLALNARDAMPGGGRLTIESANARLDEADMADNPEAKAGDYVVLSVSDAGVGMSADVRARAFEPFFTTKKVGQGSGLGLSMVYGFAKQSGGHVSLYSEEGRGTTVKLYLPRAEAAAGAG